MQTKRSEDETALPAGLDSDPPKDRDLLDRLSAKLLRLEREARDLAAAMRQKTRTS